MAFTNVTGPLTVTAQYQVATYTITFLADGNGTLNGETVQTVAHGADCSPVEAVADNGFTFLNWAGDIPAGQQRDNPLILAGVTDDLTVTAHFDCHLTVTSQVRIGTDEAGIAPADFVAKPKVYAFYTDPVSGATGKKATLKIPTPVSAKVPTNQIAAEWTKKIRLYDAKALAAAAKAGTKTADWLAAEPDRQQPLALTLRIASKQFSDRPLREVKLVAPVIAAVTVDDMTITVDGRWFGTRRPKAWAEYRIPGKGVKRLTLKALAPDGTYLDAKGKPAYMDAASGESAMVLLRPTKLPAGAAAWGDLTHLVIESGTGLGVAQLDLPE